MIFRSRVLVAAERPFKARELSAVLQPEFDIVATVELGDDLMRAAEVLRPDVIVTYLELGQLQAAEARQGAARAPYGKLVLVTGSEGFDATRPGLALGASAHVLKSSVADELRLAIHAVLRGKLYLSSSLRQSHSTSEPN